MAKYDFEFKMKLVAEYLSSTISTDRLAKKYGFKSNTQIRKWIHAYKTLGVEGLKRSRKNSSYSVDFKLKAITMYETSEKSYQSVANELGLNNPSLISRWRKQYREVGIAGLSQQQGRPPLSKKEKKEETQIKESSNPLEFSDLEKANNRIKELEHQLKMEKIKNEYLELLRSLRQEKAMKQKQESSTSSEDKKNTP